MSFSQSAFKNRVYSLALGDTKLFGNNVVNSFRATLNRGNYTKDIVPLFDYSDLGVRATPVMQDYMRLSVTGGFSVMGPGALPTGTPTWTYQFANDLSIVRGAHQFGIGANYIHNKYDSDVVPGGVRQHLIHRPGDRTRARRFPARARGVVFRRHADRRQRAEPLHRHRTHRTTGACRRT